MSYDLRLSVRVHDTDIYVQIAEPEYAHPTYNLGKMFRACMDWDYSQSEQDAEGRWQDCRYPCDFVIDRVEHGLRELRTNRRAYEKYNPENGWGNIDSAITTLESLRTCIYEHAETIPIDKLFMSW